MAITCESFKLGDIVTFGFIPNNRFYGTVVEVCPKEDKVYVDVNGKVAQFDPRELMIVLENAVGKIARRGKTLNALYWAVSPRKYKRTQVEKETGEARCPKCKAVMNRSNYTKKNKLNICPECDFKILDDSIVDERTIPVSNVMNEERNEVIAKKVFSELIQPLRKTRDYGQEGNGSMNDDMEQMRNEKIARSILAEDYEYQYDPEHAKKPAGGGWVKTEKGWQKGKSEDKDDKKDDKPKVSESKSNSLSNYRDKNGEVDLEAVSEGLRSLLKKHLDGPSGVSVDGELTIYEKTNSKGNSDAVVRLTPAKNKHEENGKIRYFINIEYNDYSKDIGWHEIDDKDSMDDIADQIGNVTKAELEKHSVTKPKTEKKEKKKEDKKEDKQEHDTPVKNIKKTINTLNNKGDFSIKLDADIDGKKYIMNSEFPELIFSKDKLDSVNDIVDKHLKNLPAEINKSTAGVEEIPDKINKMIVELKELIKKPKTEKKDNYLPYKMLKVYKKSLNSVQDHLRDSGLTNSSDEIKELAGFKDSIDKDQRLTEKAKKKKIKEKDKFWPRNAKKLKEEFIKNMDRSNYPSSEAFQKAKDRMSKMPPSDFGKILDAIVSEEDEI